MVGGKAPADEEIGCLALHAAVCKLVWASARAEELTAVLDDLEEVTLLAEDGSSANLINIAIYRSLAAEA